MRILVTGGAGKIGRTLVPALLDQGHEVSVFERTAAEVGQTARWHTGDVRDLAALRAALHGSDTEAVFHLAAIPCDRPGRDGAADVLSVNVQGTTNVLLAAHEAGVRRVIHFSSVNALGCVGGRRPAQYLPIDDSHPRSPQTAYQLSKHLAEEACRSFSDREDGLTTICLRPVYVADPTEYERTGGIAGWDPNWTRREYWGYVDLRDVVRAAQLALTVASERLPHPRHGAFLLAAKDTLSPDTTSDLVTRHYPDTLWRPGESAASHPYLSVFDCRAARAVLGWQPLYSWRDPCAERPRMRRRARAKKTLRRALVKL